MTSWLVLAHFVAASSNVFGGSPNRLLLVVVVVNGSGVAASGVLLLLSASCWLPQRGPTGTVRGSHCRTGRRGRPCQLDTVGVAHAAERLELVRHAGAGGMMMVRILASSQWARLAE